MANFVLRMQIFNLTQPPTFWKSIVLVSLFFLITPLTLFISLFSLLNLPTANRNTDFNASRNLNLIETPRSGVRVFASIPLDSPQVYSEIGVSDARVEIIKTYLSSYNSSLTNFAQKIVESADVNRIDFRLTTAIAQQESNLCKKIPEESFNCWGWGIHSKGTLGFSSFDEGIETVSKGLREDYLEKGLNTVDSIMTRYTPYSNGSWATGVKQFMSEMQ